MCQRSDVEVENKTALLFRKLYDLFEWLGVSCSKCALPTFEAKSALKIQVMR